MRGRIWTPAPSSLHSLSLSLLLILPGRKHKEKEQKSSRGEKEERGQDAGGRRRDDPWTFYSPLPQVLLLLPLLPAEVARPLSQIGEDAGGGYSDGGGPSPLLFLLHFGEEGGKERGNRSCEKKTQLGAFEDLKKPLRVNVVVVIVTAGGIDGVAIPIGETRSHIKKSGRWPELKPPPSIVVDFVVVVGYGHGHQVLRATSN